MSKYMDFNLAAIQAAPIYFNLEASTEKACELIKKAGNDGASIAAFSEAWLPGFPFYLNYSMNPFSDLAESLRAITLVNAVEVPSATTDALCDAANQGNTDVVIGIVERDTESVGTMYCTLLFISSDGYILGKHRKLKPTNRERTYWGEGDGSSLVTYERPYGRLSGLNCWEHQMMLPGYALASQGVSVHVAAWPGTNQSRHELLSRAFASQACCYVIDVGALLSDQDIPENYNELRKLMVEGGRPMEGFSHIYGPTGGISAGPAEGETVLMAKGNTEFVLGEKTWCDIGGHYSRPDILQLHINRSPHQRVVESPSPFSMSANKVETHVSPSNGVEYSSKSD